MTASSPGAGRPAGMNRDEYRKFYEQEESFWWFRGMRRIFLSLLGALARDELAGGRLLDVGCGTGGFAGFLEGARPRDAGAPAPVLTDVHPDAVRYCTMRGFSRIVRASASSLPFRGASFDIVTCLDVLQAVPDDRAALREIFRVCRPGGCLLVNDAAYEFLNDENSVAAGVIRRYTRGRLARKMREAGFDILRATYTNALLFPLIAVARGGKRIVRGRAERSRAVTDLRPYPRWLDALLYRVLSLESRWVRRWNFPFGVSVTVVARKPE